MVCPTLIPELGSLFTLRALTTRHAGGRSTAAATDGYPQAGRPRRLASGRMVVAPITITTNLLTSAIAARCLVPCESTTPNSATSTQPPLFACNESKTLTMQDKNNGQNRIQHADRFLPRPTTTLPQDLAEVSATPSRPALPLPPHHLNCPLAVGQNETRQSSRSPSAPRPLLLATSGQIRIAAGAKKEAILHRHLHT